ncbi:neurotrypsin-like isoform X2 [Dreissena polymorpha]|uniref:neurotrypsin-like isoform X2 n=1 Tax=Dreissena polymorpha TaxID=45954 RepID=UPI0022649A51|nr:neurotrypsin-like isoform X2 [Dreissena polymorpha]
MICQHFGYTNESVIQPKSNSSYPDACMHINRCSTNNMTTIDDIPKQCDVFYGSDYSDYDNLYKEINCIPAQLADGASKLQGRVEAGLFGQLNSICSLGFDSRAANVLCASLGYKRGSTQLWTNSYFGAGSLSIYKRNITCSGDEISLKLCSHSDMEIPGCDNRNVVGVECEGDIIKIEPLFTSRPYEGIVDGYHGDLRYDIVGNVSSTTAKTLCTMLGYGRVGFSGLPIPGRTLDYFKQYVICSGTESSISECVGEIEYCVERNYYHCEQRTQWLKRVIIFCSDYKIQGLRLGSDGKLLMEINGRQWGSCIDYFTTQTAQSACIIMGYSGNATFSGQTGGTNDVEIMGSLVCSANAIIV